MDSEKWVAPDIADYYKDYEERMKRLKEEHQAELHRDCFDCSLRAYAMDKEGN